MSWPQDYELPRTVWPYPLPAGWTYREQFYAKLHLLHNALVVRTWEVTTGHPTREEVIADTIETLLQWRAIVVDGEGEW